MPYQHPKIENYRYVEPRSVASRGSSDADDLSRARGNLNTEARILRARGALGPRRDEIDWGTDDD